MSEENNVRFASEEELKEMLEEPKTIEKSVDPDAITVKDDCDCVCSVASKHHISSYQELLNCVFSAEMDYQYWKNKYDRKEVKLWLDTKWDEVFDKKPTVDEKKMYIKRELQDVKKFRDSHKMYLDDVKRLYEVALKYGWAYPNNQLGVL